MTWKIFIAILALLASGALLDPGSFRAGAQEPPDAEIVGKEKPATTELQERPGTQEQAWRPQLGRPAPQLGLNRTAADANQP